MNPKPFPTFLLSFLISLGMLAQNNTHIGNEFIIETPMANWILLDSLRFVNKTEGEIGEKQLKWLTGLLDANPDKPAVIL